MMRTLRWTFFLLCAPFLLHAQQTQPAADTAQSGTAWTLKQCIDYALANSLQVERSGYNVENSKLDYNLSRAEVLPSVNGSAQYGLSWGRTLVQNTYTYTTGEQRSLSGSLNASVPLFNGFRIQNSIRQYSHNYDAANLDLQKTKNDVILNVASLYITVVFDKEQLENAKSQLASSQQQYERTKKQVAAGSLPRSSELNLDAQVATNEVNLITRENNLNLSLLRLKQALQMPGGAALDVEIPQIDVEDLVLEQSRDQIFDIARQSMPEIKSADLKKEASYYAVKAAKGDLLPRLSLTASTNTYYSSSADGLRFISDGSPATPVYDTIGNVHGVDDQFVIARTPRNEFSGKLVNGYGYRDQLKDNIARSVGLSLTIPILNGFRSRTAWQRAVISQRVAEVDAKEMSNTLRQSVETAYNDAVAASKTYNSSLRQVQARDEAFRMTKQRFEAGATNYVEYQVAENDLFQAKSDLVRAKYDFIFKKKVLDFYQGKPLAY
ncbi:TolC family protein [Fulvivirgaceae bacterium PWU5]|uniref:TolC family protein n=1 Tax=Dawidia cretensis TaxID=2782350 RepID=A0AAP2DY24_9BACT|nr:TolC family protein [Dawidia cretensis]MBT1708504.1 TolC family protein [Dawidia cretensis]